jgi:uncharacterized protein (TIGR02118 family)
MAAKLLVLYHQPTDSAAFDAYYHSTHVPLAKAIPGLRSLAVSDGPIASPGGAASYHLAATLKFDSLAALQGALGSPEGAAAAGDLPNFASGGATLLMFEEREV